MNLEFNVMRIKSVHKQTDRETAVAAFNDVYNSVQILVTSLRISITVVDL